MDKKEIEITVDKNNKVDLHDFIEMKIKYEVEYQEKDKEIERLTISYNDALEELEKKENIIKEVGKYIEKYDFITGYYEYNYDDVNDTYTHYTVKEELEEILDKGSDKE